MNRTIVIAAALLMALAGCGEKQKPVQPGTNDLTGTNKWIRDELERWYYWHDALTASTAPANSLSYDEFLRQSLIDLSAAKDPDGTIDGGYDEEGNRYLYSRIDRITGASRASASEEVTYGLGVIAIGYQNTSPQEFALLVTWVLPDGPAERAGLKRGMILDRFNGRPIYRAELDAFSAQLFSQSTQTITLADSEATFPLTGESTRIDPILVDKVITTEGGTKVAYLMYNAFEQGQVDVEGGLGEFDRDLRYVFGSFAALGATELVLDLRYNGGGAVISSQLLSSLAGEVNTSQLFASLQYNKTVDGDNPRPWRFMDEQNSMNLHRVYVLATGDTASASELFINSLRGVDIEVVLIGERTEGKNVGMNLMERTDGIYRYEMWPITFKSANAKGFSDYSSGFAPDVELDELGALFRTPRGVLYDFGDPQETMLNAALTLIDGGTVSRSSSTRAEAGVETVSLRNPRAGGARIYNSPDTE